MATLVLVHYFISLLVALFVAFPFLSHARIGSDLNGHHHLYAHIENHPILTTLKMAMEGMKEEMKQQTHEIRLLQYENQELKQQMLDFPQQQQSLQAHKKNNHKTDLVHHHHQQPNQLIQQDAERDLQEVKNQVNALLTEHTELKAQVEEMQQATSVLGSRLSAIEPSSISTTQKTPLITHSDRAILRQDDVTTSVFNSFQKKTERTLEDTQTRLASIDLHRSGFADDHDNDYARLLRDDDDDVNTMHAGSSAGKNDVELESTTSNQSAFHSVLFTSKRRNGSSISGQGDKTTTTSDSDDRTSFGSIISDPVVSVPHSNFVVDGVYTNTNTHNNNQVVHGRQMSSSSPKSAASSFFTLIDVHMAAAKNDVDNLRQMLSVEPLMVNQQDDKMWNTLHIAAFAGHVDVFRLLMQSGGNPLLRTNTGKTPRDLALEYLGASHPIMSLL